jgi:hypothetical protein
MNPYEIGTMADSLYASYEFYFSPRNHPMSHPTPFRAFHNALRILRSLDYHEVSFLSEEEWESFRDNPYKFFTSTSDSNASLIWAAIQRRQPVELKQNV